MSSLSSHVAVSAAYLLYMLLLNLCCAGDHIHRIHIHIHRINAGEMLSKLHQLQLGSFVWALFLA